MKEDRVVGTRGSFTDITEKKKLEERLRQSLKMEAIGGDERCNCPGALAGAIITNLEYIPREKKRQLKLLIEKYVECQSP